MTIINRKSQSYKVSALLSDNVPLKPDNYIHNLNLMDYLEVIVATLGYDLRRSAPGHSIGHFTHPEWGHRLVNQYKARGQVLALLNQSLGILNIADKQEKTQANADNNIRGARKANLYKKYLFDAVGPERFNEIIETLRITHPDIFVNPSAKSGKT